MKVILYLFLLLATFQSYGQNKKLNLKLKSQLDSIGLLDQKYRILLMGFSGLKQRDSIAKTLSIPASELDWYIQKNMVKVDSSNMVFIDNVIKRFGYPGKTLVGEGTNKVAWYVIQHSDKIPQYIGLIKKSGKKGEIPLRLVATMEDRYLMGEKKEQIYGTQACSGCLKNGDKRIIIWPIKDPASVNIRRKKVGIEETVEQYAQDFNIRYEVIPISEVK